MDIYIYVIMYIYKKNMNYVRVENLAWSCVAAWYCLQMFRCAWPSLFQYHRDRDPVQAASVFAWKFVHHGDVLWLLVCWSYWHPAGERLHPHHLSAKERIETCQLRETCAIICTCCSLCLRVKTKMDRIWCKACTIPKLSRFTWTHCIFSFELLLRRFFQPKTGWTVPSPR